jgi:hypothetical protein
MKCQDCAEYGSEFCRFCLKEDTTVSSVAMPDTMMPKKLLRRKDPKIQEIIMVDRRYKEAKRGGPVLLKKFRKYIQDPE